MDHIDYYGEHKWCPKCNRYVRFLIRSATDLARPTLASAWSQVSRHSVEEVRFGHPCFTSIIALSSETVHNS